MKNVLDIVYKFDLLEYFKLWEKGLSQKEQDILSVRFNEELVTNFSEIRDDMFSLALWVEDPLKIVDFTYYCLNQYNGSGSISFLDIVNDILLGFTDIQTFEHLEKLVDTDKLHIIHPQLLLSIPDTGNNTINLVKKQYNTRHELFLIFSKHINYQALAENIVKLSNSYSEKEKPFKITIKITKELDKGFDIQPFIDMFNTNLVTIYTYGNLIFNPMKVIPELK